MMEIMALYTKLIALVLAGLILAGCGDRIGSENRLLVDACEAEGGIVQRFSYRTYGKLTTYDYIVICDFTPYAKEIGDIGDEDRRLWIDR